MDSKLLQLNGPFRNPYEPDIIMWIKGGTMYAIQYPYKILGVIPAQNNSFRDDMFIKEKAFSDVVPANFNSAPILQTNMFDALKKNYFFYDDLSTTNKEELRYYVYNYYKGSKAKPIDALHQGTNEVKTAAVGVAPIITTESKENQSDTPSDPLGRKFSQMLKDFFLSKPMIYGVYTPIAIYIGYQIYMSRKNK